MAPARGLMTYRSKVDGWLLAVALTSSLVCLAAGAALMLSYQPGVSLIALFLILVAAFPVWLLGATYYVLGDDLLLVRSGPFTWRVPIREISSVSLTRDSLSSPALSVDRLRIDYGRARSIMISPREREAFLAELAARRDGHDLPRLG